MMRVKMSFGEGVRQGFRKLLTFSGRARRKEFVSYGGVVTLVMLALLLVIFALIDFIPTFAVPTILIVIGVLYLFMMLSITIRRFQDVGKSATYYVLMLMAIPPIVMPFDFKGANILTLVAIGVLGLTLSYLLSDSQPETNEYGPSPKYVIRDE